MPDLLSKKIFISGFLGICLVIFMIAGFALYNNINRSTEKKKSEQKTNEKIISQNNLSEEPVNIEQPPDDIYEKAIEPDISASGLKTQESQAGTVLRNYFKNVKLTYLNEKDDIVMMAYAFKRNVVASDLESLENLYKKDGWETVSRIPGNLTLIMKKTNPLKELSVDFINNGHEADVEIREIKQ